MLLNVYDRSAYVQNEYFLKGVFQFVNLLYLVDRASLPSDVPSSINLLWILHTLIISYRTMLCFEIMAERKGKDREVKERI